MKRLNFRHTILCCYFGYITQAIVNNLAPLLFLIFQDTFGFSLKQITLVITVNFSTQILVDFLSVKYADRIGYRTCLVASHAFSAAGLSGMAFLPYLLPNPYTGLLCSVVLYAIGGGITEVLISPTVEACPTDNKAAVMSLLHSFYCWGTVGVIAVSTLFLFVFGKSSWRFLCCLWALLPIVNGIRFMHVPIVPLVEKGNSMKLVEMLRTPLFWLMLLLMMASGASEQGMSQWASAFAEKGLHISKAVGDLLGPCMFSVFMGISRVFYAKSGDRISLSNYIVLSGLLCVLSYMLAAFSSSPVPGLIGCAVCGLSVGILWPGFTSLSAVCFPRGGTAIFAFLALAGDIGCGYGPTLVGLLAGRFRDQLKYGLAGAVLFPVVVVLGTLILKKTKNHF